MAFAVVVVEKCYNSCRGFWLVEILVSAAPERVGPWAPNGW